MALLKIICNITPLSAVDL